MGEDRSPKQLEALHTAAVAVWSAVVKNQQSLWLDLAQQSHPVLVVENELEQVVVYSIYTW